MPIKTGSFALLLAVAFTAGAGQVYKWIDGEDRVHYSDTPRPGWTRVDLKAAPGFTPVTAAPDVGGYTPPDDASESPQGTQLRAEECQKRREQLETYRNSTQISERDNLGNERVFNEEQRLQLIERTQQQVNELCDSE